MLLKISINNVVFDYDEIKNKKGPFDLVNELMTLSETEFENLVNMIEHVVSRAEVNINANGTLTFVGKVARYVQPFTYRFRVYDKIGHYDGWEFLGTASSGNMFKYDLKNKNWK